MSKKITLSLEPVLQATGRARVKWQVSQANGAGDPIAKQGRRTDMVKVFKATVRARLDEGYQVDAKVYTAAGQLEEHATYKPDGAAHFHYVAPPEGEGGFGRACRTLAGTSTTRKARRTATAAPKRPKAPRKPRKAAPKKTAAPRKAAPKKTAPKRTTAGAPVDPKILKDLKIGKAGKKAKGKEPCCCEGAPDPKLLKKLGIDPKTGAKKKFAPDKAQRIRKGAGYGSHTGQPRVAETWGAPASKVKAFARVLVEAEAAGLVKAPITMTPGKADGTFDYALHRKPATLAEIRKWIKSKTKASAKPPRKAAPKAAPKRQARKPAKKKTAPKKPTQGGDAMEAQFGKFLDWAMSAQGRAQLGM